MLLAIKVTNHFKKDQKRLEKRNKNLKKLIEVIDLLAESKKLPKKYSDHLEVWPEFVRKRVTLCL